MDVRITLKIHLQQKRPTYSIRFFNIYIYIYIYMASFKRIENKHDVYRSRDYMKKVSGSLRKHVMEIINFKEEKMMY